MKKILLASAASVAFAGAASAGGHVTYGFGGSLDFGWYDGNNANGFDVSGTIDFDMDADLGNGISANLNVQISVSEGGFDFDQGSGDMSFTISQDAGAMGGYIKYGDLDDGGASELFYASRSGMHLDVNNADNDDDFVARIDMDMLSVAVGCTDVGGGDGPPCGDFSFGAGMDVGGLSIGFGYDQEAQSWSDSQWAISADTEVGAISLGVSYMAQSDGDTAMGIEVGADVTDNMSVGFYYANNDASWGGSTESDEVWGIDASFSSGAMELNASYEAEVGDSETRLRVWGSLDVAEGTTVHAGYQQDDSDFNGGSGDSGFYAGITHEVSDLLTITASYSELYGEVGPEFGEGVALFGTVSF